MKAGDLVPSHDFEVMLVAKIDDSRLHPDMSYCISGCKHYFRSNSSNSRSLLSYDPESCDAIIEASEEHYGAKLVEGEWWWVNLCAQCCGHERNWMSKECEKHSVCRTCGISEKDANGSRYGDPKGWQCLDCYNKERTSKRQKALTRVQEKIDSGDYDEWDYRNEDKIICPHCDNSYEPDIADGVPEGEERCDVCGGVFRIEPEYSITYTTTIVGERVTPDTPMED